jgi:hypothetical protein
MSMSTSGKRSPRLIALRKRNNGSPGVDGVSFSDIEARGLNGFLKEIQQELEGHTYRPSRVRKQWIPKANGKFRELSIPTIKDRVVQGALKLILEAVFEADFQSGSYGYRPKRTAQAAVTKVAQAIVRGKTKVIDLDLMSYFDNVVHPIVLKKVAQRVNDEDILKLLKRVLKALTLRLWPPTRLMIGRALVETLLAKGIEVVIPPRSNRKQPRKYNTHLYKQRHWIERFFGKIKHDRWVFSRFEKTRRNSLAMLHFASALIWLR